MGKIAARRVAQVNVLGVGVHAVDMQKAALILKSRIRENAKGYVCLMGVHGIMEAQRDPGLKLIFAEAALVAPDGMPTVWMGHLQGFSAQSLRPGSNGGRHWWSGVSELHSFLLRRGYRCR
jgi:N-acetylglucosaminyldiphosphoundecaprenol N-acetyl-beta-D-mannosaminyltransferase